MMKLPEVDNLCDLLISFAQMHMETFVKIVIKRLKDANLFASQGGPIILAQVRQSKTVCSSLFLLRFLFGYI
jgi:hypothetical protein